MSRPAKLTPAQQRERRARIALVGLVAVLALVCAVQAPKLLHHASAAPSDTAPSPAAGSAGAASLAAAAVAPAPAPHLRRLRGFAWKDPFRQQLQPKTSQLSSPQKTPPATKQSAPPQTTTTMRTPPAVVESTPPSQAKTLAPPPTSVVLGKPGVLLLLDGRKLGLLPGDLFPTADPVFRLVSFTKTTARIALVTGTLAGGASTLELQVGHRLVLRDATTGDTYALVLVRPARVVQNGAKPPKA